MTKSFRERRGAILALLAVSMIGLIGVLVLSIDAGSLQQQRRIAQTAADAGALAAAVELLRNRSDSIVASAKSETSRNGFTDRVNGDTVTVTYPATGTFSGTHYANVVVQRRAPTIFAGIFGQAAATIRARATGGLVLDEYCFIVLDPTGTMALDLENTARLTGSGCGIAVNSSDAVAAFVNSNAHVSAPAIGVVGGVSGSNFTPTPQVGIAPVADPVAWMQVPTVPNTCDHTSMVVSSTMTLSPGTYCQGLKVLNGQATLQPGLYILRGGGLEVKSATSTLLSTGTGVTFYNTSAPGGGGYGPILMQANVTVNISANTDPNSALPGVLFYSDAAAPNLTNVFKAGSGSTMNGTMYFPTQTVDFSSGSTSVVNGSLVAFRVDIKNNTDMTFTGYNGGSAYDALRRPAIVE